MSKNVRKAPAGTEAKVQAQEARDRAYTCKAKLGIQTRLSNLAIFDLDKLARLTKQKTDNQSSFMIYVDNSQDALVGRDLSSQKIQTLFRFRKAVADVLDGLCPLINEGAYAQEEIETIGEDILNNNQADKILGAYTILKEINTQPRLLDTLRMIDELGKAKKRRIEDNQIVVINDLSDTEKANKNKARNNKTTKRTHDSKPKEIGLQHDICVAKDVLREMAIAANFDEAVLNL